MINKKEDDKKKVEKFIINICIRCKEKINLEVDNSKMMYFCPKCKVMCANIYYNKQLNDKQEVKMTDKKKAKAPKAEKQVTTETEETKEKTPGISEQRQANAEKVIDFMKNELKLADAECRKVFSRAYGIIVKGQKK